MVNNYLLPLKSDRLLDVLRGIAVLMVIMIHLGFMLYNMNSVSSSAVFLNDLNYVARFGSAGPMLFFLISGFLLYSLYFKKYSSKTFFKRRLARIYPMWVLFTLVSIFSAYTTGFYGDGVKLDSIQNIATVLLFLVFLGILVPSTWDFIPGGWSIQGEVINYILFPFIKKYSIYLVLSLQILYASIVLVVENMNLGSEYEGYVRSLEIVSTATFWFILGVLVSKIALKDIKVNAIFFVYVVIFVAGNIILQAPNNISQFQSSVAIIVAILLGLLIENKFNIIAKMLASIGMYSYGIYLIHFIFLSAAGAISTKIFSQIETSNLFITFGISLAIFCIVTTLSFYTAKIVYKHYELPFINMGKR